MELLLTISRIRPKSTNTFGKEKLNLRSFANDYATKIFLSIGSS
jgi:hypothetical protein